MRFLDAEGIKKREPRKNPEKAVPRKERKADGREAAKAAAPRRSRRRKRSCTPPQKESRAAALKIEASSCILSRPRSAVSR